MSPTTRSDAVNGQTRRRQKSHAALIGAGLALLEEGRPNASIDEITRRAGVGFGTFYNHFDSKEELFAEATYSLLDMYAAWLREATSELSDPAEIFARRFRLTGRLASERPHLIAPLLTQGTEVLLVERGLRDAALADISEGVSSGRFADVDPEILLMIVGGALLGLLRLLGTHSEWDDARVSDQVTERMLCMLGVSATEAQTIAVQPLTEVPDPDRWLADEG